MRPWLALAISLVALVAWFWPRSRDLLLYDRSWIADGQWWRLWTGHVAHHSGTHLGWNLVVFFPAAVWLERIRPAMGRCCFAISPWFISGVLWYFDPKLHYYGGLSGVTIGVVTLLALVQLCRDSGEGRWIWKIFLVLIMGKIAAEFLHSETTLFAGLPPGVRNVPLAHLAGAIFAGLLFLATARGARR
ncbi:MAG: rhombosortase [Opitutaceae bacterium]